MKNINKALLLTILFASTVVLSSCGGDGISTSTNESSSNNTNNASEQASSVSSTGVVAVGTALVGAKITIVDSLGNKKEDLLVDINGNYAFPAGLTGPVVLKAVLDNYELYSAYPTAPDQTLVSTPSGDVKLPEGMQIKQININTLTDIMTRQGLAGDLDSYFSGALKPTYQNTQGLLDSVARLSEQLGSIAVKLGILTEEELYNSNPFTTVMQADKKNPLDRLMESFEVECSPSLDNECEKYKITPKFPVSQSVTDALDKEFDLKNNVYTLPELDTTQYEEGDVPENKNFADFFKEALEIMGKNNPEWLVTDCRYDKGLWRLDCDIKETLSSTSTVQVTYAYGYNSIRVWVRDDN